MWDGDGYVRIGGAGMPWRGGEVRNIGGVAEERVDSPGMETRCLTELDNLSGGNENSSSCSGWEIEEVV